MRWNTWVFASSAKQTKVKLNAIYGTIMRGMRFLYALIALSWQRITLFSSAWNVGQPSSEPKKTLSKPSKGRKTTQGSKGCKKPTKSQKAKGLYKDCRSALSATRSSSTGKQGTPKRRKYPKTPNT